MDQWLVAGGGVVRVGGRTGLVVEWLAVAGGVLDDGVVVTEGVVGVVRGVGCGCGCDWSWV